MTKRQLHYIGLDLGTSSVKALLIDSDQQVLASSNAPLTVQRPHPGWSEQLPSDWQRAADQALSALSQQADLSTVQAIGLSGHMHGATLLNAEGEVLRPCLLWNDTRAHAEAAEFDADPDFRALSGNIVFPGFTAPKVEWVRRHEPHLFAQLATVLLPKDYLRFWLSGALVSEMSDAAGTAWLDVAARDWSDTLLTKCNLTRAHMPTLVEGTAASATLKPSLSKRWGLPDNVIIAGGAGDNAAAACGLGTVCDGQAFLSLGTSGVLFAAGDTYRPKPESAVHAFCHALPNSWHQMGVILSATDALNWFAALVGTDAATLTTALGEQPGAPSGVTFLPYLSGERTPHNDPTPAGAFVGIAHRHGPSALTHAVLEGVGFALKDNLLALRSTGTEITHLLATGGGSQSRYWVRLLATILNLPISIPANGELGAALGAARLAMTASGLPVDQVMTSPKIADTFDPDVSLVAEYTQAHARFAALYPAVKAVT